jgi:hypothetical protein
MVQSTKSKAAGGYYSVVSEAKDMPLEIFFGVKGTIPAELDQAKREFERTNKSILKLYTSAGAAEKRSDNFKRLLLGAQLLAGESPAIDAALSALASVREGIVVDEGPVLRRRYLSLLAKFAIPAGLVLLVLGLLFRLRVYPSSWSATAADLATAGNYLFLIGAAEMLLPISFYSRGTLHFDELIDPTGDLEAPIWRVLSVAIFTVLLAGLAYLRIVGVSIGSFSTSDLGTNTVSALLFGAMCGFSERLLATTVGFRLRNLLGGIAQSAKDAPAK